MISTILGVALCLSTTDTPTHSSWKRITFSVYSACLHGGPVARGGRYDRNKLTCASNTHRFGTILEIRYKDRLAHVTVTDRMATRFTGSRIDLSSRAFAALYPKYDMRTTRSMDRTGTLLRGEYHVIYQPKKPRR